MSFREKMLSVICFLFLELHFRNMLNVTPFHVKFIGWKSISNMWVTVLLLVSFEPLFLFASKGEIFSILTSFAGTFIKLFTKDFGGMFDVPR